ncbi:NAD(P)/FAD-dependent oxidoreductase [Emcibacter nanhaiensis]|uniref:FAD-binding oxidoreductase n=1 Tax=Emcibacter nanhaiensis TaxID=1505037 RepID=A0A501PA09_9PROT|nr:FAD-binding oxidoreductase [Emcibacter nanhaiensis]TPD56857.1 FAD-binding oxidoreductase [Emcibacter nanhaiensis]
MTNSATEGSASGRPAFPHRSFWSDDYGTYSPGAPLSQSLTVDVAIIGAGFTGLSAAINLKELDASTSVVVLEQEAIGFGASGRNSGWVWPNLTTYRDIYAKQGLDVLRETYQYAQQAYGYVRDLTNSHSLDSEYRETGLLRPAVTGEYEPDMYEYMEFCEKLGRSQKVTELSENAVQKVVRSPLFSKGLWDEELALIHPVRHARSLADLARRLGSAVYEQSPVIDIREEENAVYLSTPSGSVKADRLIVATNGYTHLLPGVPGKALKCSQRPVIAYNTISRPLTNDEWDSVGWTKRNAVYSFGPASHFGNPTSDGRIHWCSDRFLGIPDGDDISREYHPNYNPTLKKQTPHFFPGLKDLTLTHHWGGPASVTYDHIFHLGALGNSKRIFTSVGCNGNGVSLTHLNGKILAELVAGRKSGLCDLWFVNHKVKTFPPTMITVPAMKFIIGRELKTARKRAVKAGLGFLTEEISGGEGA